MPTVSWTRRCAVWVPRGSEQDEGHADLRRLCPGFCTQRGLRAVLQGRPCAVGRSQGPSVSCRALGVPVTDYTFEDCQLALAEGQLRLPADTCLLEFARLVRGLG